MTNCFFLSEWISDQRGKSNEGRKAENIDLRFMPYNFTGGHDDRDKDSAENYEFEWTLLQSAPYPVLVTGLDTSINYVNPAFESLSGFTCSELLGRKSPYPWWPLEKIGEYGQANTEGRKIELNKLERYYQNKNGELFWVALHIAPVKYKGEIHHYIANWVDITERKRAEEALLESEARFRMLSETSLSGIFIFCNARFTYVNPAFAAMVACRSRDDLIRCDPSYLIHPDDRNLITKATRRRLRGNKLIFNIPFVVFAEMAKSSGSKY